MDLLIIQKIRAVCFLMELYTLQHVLRTKNSLSFDVNDERFREILLPQNYLDGYFRLLSEGLAVFKGSLALIAFTEALADKSKICHIWVMKEYGAVKSWTKKSVLMKDAARFFDCTVNGELLICKFRPFQRLSFDPESLNEEILRIPNAGSMIYTANFVESLVLLDGINISSKYRNQQVGVSSKVVIFLKFILTTHYAVSNFCILCICE